MDQTVKIAQDLLQEPNADLQQIVDHPETSTEAKAALVEASHTASSSSSAAAAAAAAAVTQKSSTNGDGNTMLQATNKAGDGRLQVVNEDQQFTDQLSNYLGKWGMIDKGFAYDVVAVFGSQSTGKSTLLNRLFGTSFQEMNESKRQQTTKGIWMCPSAYSSTLVMDVEGTDGRERGEDQDFQRKSALFSLASTEVLIVNLWEHQIGLYQGANMALLKTVFEVNLGLFGGGGDEANKAKPKEKTLVLFVIRDHVGATPMENLTATLTQDMDKLWDGLSKPEHLAEAALHDYFDLSFAALPHKILMPEKFESAVVELRKRFTDRSREDYVFQPTYHKRIPADGISFYMEGIWQQVLTNKDLDLPTQQELLAQFRCDEIAAGVIEAFSSSSKPVRKPVETGLVIQHLGAMMNDWLHIALGKFDKDASRYHTGVYQRKRSDLLTTLHASLLPLYLGQLKNLHKQISAQYVKDLTAGLKEPNYDFAKVVLTAHVKARADFQAGAKATKVDETSWTDEQELASLEEDLKVIADRLRADETKKMVNAIERTVRRHLVEPVEIAMSQPKPEMWDVILETYAKVLSEAEESYLSKAQGYNCSEEENDVALMSLRARTWLVLRRKLEEQASDATMRNTLRTAFEDRFRYDDQGLPRVWKPDDDIETAFKKAKDETLNLLPLFADIKPTNPKLAPSIPTPEPSFDADADPVSFDASTALNLLSPAKLVSLETRFKRDADAAYVEAKRSMVSSVAQIPLWMYGVLVALGWNEAMAVLFNPLYFAMLLVLGATGYIILQLGLAGPILQILRTVIAEIRRIAVNKLREAFAENPEAQRILSKHGVPVSSSRNLSETSYNADIGTMENEAKTKGDLLAAQYVEK